MLQIAHPQLHDFSLLAQSMRSDEVRQYLALTGLDEYCPDVAARAFAAIPGLNYVVLERGKPVLMGGFAPLRPGVYDAWLMGTDEAWAVHGFAFTRICRRAMDRLLQHTAHRVELVALADRTAAHVWYARGLGMVCEGVRPQYFADRQDGMAFARVARSEG